MSEDELLQARMKNEQLATLVKADAERGEKVGARIDYQLSRNHFAELFYETMKRRERKA